MSVDANFCTEILQGTKQWAVGEAIQCKSIRLFLISSCSGELKHEKTSKQKLFKSHLSLSICWASSPLQPLYYVSATFSFHKIVKQIAESFLCFSSFFPLSFSLSFTFTLYDPFSPFHRHVPCPCDCEWEK